MKKLFACLLLMSMLFALVGCANNQENNQPSTHMNGTTSTPTTQPTTVLTTQPTSDPTTQPTTTPTTRPTTPIVLPTAPDTDPSEFEYKPADIPQEYWAVLNNQQAIYFRDGVSLKNGDYNAKVAFLDDIRTNTMPHDIAAYSCSYYVTDVDIDGRDDLLLLSLNTFLLSEKGGVVYGKILSARTYFYSDGTMHYSTQAGAVEVACEMVYLGNGKWISVDKWRVDRTDDTNTKYYIAQIEVTADEFQSYLDSQKYNEIEWKDMARYPLYAPELSETPPGG